LPFIGDYICHTIGIGAINKITHTGDYGDINFIGGGVGNFITRSGEINKDIGACQKI
jgi:hypothetical protein